MTFWTENYARYWKNSFAANPKKFLAKFPPNSFVIQHQQQKEFVRKYWVPLKCEEFLSSFSWMILHLGGSKLATMPRSPSIRQQQTCKTSFSNFLTAIFLYNFPSLSKILFLTANFPLDIPALTAKLFFSWDLRFLKHFKSCLSRSTVNWTIR